MIRCPASCWADRRVTIGAWLVRRAGRVTDTVVLPGVVVCTVVVCTTAPAGTVPLAECELAEPPPHAATAATAPTNAPSKTRRSPIRAPMLVPVQVAAPSRIAAQMDLGIEGRVALVTG